MAYGLKYKFVSEATHDITYEVRILERDFEGTAVQRPLGSAPVIHMQEADPIRATSVDLVLECQSDGEYVDLYSLDPRQYKVQIYRGTASKIWEGFIATELYSEPDIAPPYDVRVTATDGLGVLKEYQYETGWGGRTVREQLQQMLLPKTGLSLDIYTVSRLREYGETTMSFLDEVKIDLDYMDDKNCYEVLCELLTTMRCVITQWRGAWLIIRTADLNGQIKSNGDVTIMESEYRGVNDTYSYDMEYLTARLGQMGGAETDMWPIGYLTRRIVPAKKSVKVRAPWHWKSGFPRVADNGWTIAGNGSFITPGNYYKLGQPSHFTAQISGTLAATVVLSRFMQNFKVTVKASAQYPDMNIPGVMQSIKILAAWTDTTNNVVYYFDPSTGWTTTSVDGERTELRVANPEKDINATQEVSYEFPAIGLDTPGWFTVNVIGAIAEVYEILVEPGSVNGYEDIIFINNDARGAAQGIEIAGGRVTSWNLMSIDFLRGVFFREDAITAFSDGSNINKDFMSLTALAYAKENAAPRIEITGNLDFPASITFPPVIVKSHGVWALVSSYDWNLKESEYSIKAVTLPTATLVVDSEEIKSIPND